ncbi:alpha-glucosidase-like [Hylaeus volcanicus]|uniref:alpha-glucosidase-like n=1 Tax=Hylaeus volcanicus TaxID=313075 RepID=UPI0023B84369|nr:alpha-glucosidase-like [Hylaeus volcanicus]XP_053985168.1 alpha-glucosidase-like [Hylaeus volcanicus]XP_053985178.1 alpha-glucosidase-like [Hylaeus volcanicus]
MRTVIVFCVISLSLVAGSVRDDPDWWRTMSLYQIYPRSFKDSDGDGTGDLKGIQSKLQHLIDSNVDAFWMSPIYPSPMVDSGYDISDFRNINPTFGTLQDFDELVRAAHNKSLRVIMDLVPNHSSDKHEWFQKSLQNIEPYDNYYVWHKGKVLANGTVVRPNNWVSVFGGSAWTWREERQAYYLHHFAPEQPDLNYVSEHVVREMKDIMRFWLDKGVDGFRVDAVNHLCEDNRFLDEPLSGKTSNPDMSDYTVKIYTEDQPQTYEVVRGWREVLDEYKDSPRIMMMEAYTNMSMTMKYYVSGAHFPFNFKMLVDLNENSTAADFQNVINGWISNMPYGSTANWVNGNHDKSRLVARLGEQKARVMTLMALLLPGVSVTYNGEEIGMNDTHISWEDTQDPQGCNAGKEGYEKSSRDPARTPFQWDNTTSAGFSRNPKTWLPVNENYKTLNLASEKEDEHSYYSFYKTVSNLKKSPMAKNGNLITKLLNENVFSFARETLKDGSIYVVVNLGHEEETVDLSVFDNVSRRLNLYYATGRSDLLPRSLSVCENIKIPPSVGVVFVSKGDDSHHEHHGGTILETRSVVSMSFSKVDIVRNEWTKTYLDD